MYNETVNGLSSIAMVIVFAWILYVWLRVDFSKVSDEIVLGRIIEPESYATYKDNPIVSVKAKVNKPKKKKKKKKNKAKQALKEDCHKAAMSLGAKKKEADYLVQKVFSENKIKTVQDFIQRAYA
tara:strand:+ start:1206 stop:1580 length:375 start_codon:yes stop_codon:yes gene_type:complete